jgi:hypothetical protein
MVECVKAQGLCGLREERLRELEPEAAEPADRHSIKCWKGPTKNKKRKAGFCCFGGSVAVNGCSV